MRNRITIQTTEEMENVLEQIRNATGRATKSDVVRDALELYDLIAQHAIRGENLFLGTTRDSAAAVLLPHLQRAASRMRLMVVTPQPVLAPPAPAGVEEQGMDEVTNDRRRRATTTGNPPTRPQSHADSP